MLKESHQPPNRSSRHRDLTAKPGCMDCVPGFIDCGVTVEPDIKGRDKFYDQGDKNSPQFFAGRRELISAIETTVDNLRDDIGRLLIAKVTSNQKTWLIQGAPGAGKTALQQYLSERWEADKDGSVVVNALLGELTDRDKLTAKIANSMLPKGEDQLRTEHTVSRTAGLVSGALEGSGHLALQHRQNEPCANLGAVAAGRGD